MRRSFQHLCKITTYLTGRLVGAGHELQMLRVRVVYATVFIHGIGFEL